MSKFKDITGQKFGKMTAIKFLKSGRKNNQIWLWKCDCGNELSAYIFDIKRYKHQCCNCTRQVGNSTLSRMNEYISGAQRRGLDFYLSLDETTKLLTDNCFYCGRKGDSKSHARDKVAYCGIDRISSDKGYTIDNCVSCCKHCNYLKHYMSKNQFLYKVKKIYENRLCSSKVEQVNSN